MRRCAAAWCAGCTAPTEAGLDGESVLALFMSTFQDTQKEDEETA